MIRNRRLVPLKRDESMALLAAAPMGRLVFHHRSLPAVRPVLHLVERGEILIRSRWTPAESTPRAAAGIVVAYEADEFDRATETGWSVVVVGTAAPVEDAALTARIGRALDPWAEGPRDVVIAVSPAIVTGRRIVVDGALITR